MNLLDLLQVNIRLKQVARTNGGEYAGPCPFCGGCDRFRVWPNQDRGRYWCRVCGKHGDAIDYLKETRGLSFRDACAELGIEPANRQGGPAHEPIQGVLTPRETIPPGDLWSNFARIYLDSAKEILHEEKEIMAWLHRRGLNDNTIDRAELGWIRADILFDRRSWGLKPEKKENGKDKRLWFPAGLVIPLVLNGTVARLRIRRRQPDGDFRYYILPGSDTRPMGFQLARNALVIVESELDGLLIDQEAGDLVGTVALGSVGIRPDQEKNEILNQADPILVSLDFDEAGAKASWNFWTRTYPKAKRWPVPVGKDPGEAFQKGLNIRAWVEAGLRTDSLPGHTPRPTDAMIKPFPKEWVQRFDEAQLERLAIMTIDGQLSDREAMILLN